jgi:HlyD family secretion protein
VAGAAQLAADQASIDSAKAQLKLAKQNLAAAILTSPLAGRVGSISLSAGSRSSGGSITIVGNGNQIVTIDVPLSQIDQVKTGQPASIAVDGRTDALHAAVTRVGIVSSTSGSLTTFPVTVTLADGSPALHNGVGADVTITTGTAADVLLVPNSAITTVGSRHTVTIVRDGKTSTASVTLGLTGVDSSQVTGGLSAGDEVELADPDQGLPSSATSSSTTGGFGRVVFPAGSLPAGGFGGLRPGG